MKTLQGSQSKYKIREGGMGTFEHLPFLFASFDFTNFQRSRATSVSREIFKFVASKNAGNTP